MRVEMFNVDRHQRHLLWSARLNELFVLRWPAVRLRHGFRPLTAADESF